MSILSNRLSELLSLLFPAECIACGATLEGRQESICFECRAMMPTTNFHLLDENPMLDKIRSLCPQVESASAQFYYINNGRWRRVIHAIKYHHSWQIAVQLGYWYGSELLEAEIYHTIDCVVPIPLHRRKLLSRRYNQSEKIAQGLAEAMGVELNRSAVIRSHNNPSQVTRNAEQRWGNVQDIFSVVRPSELEGRHILLVDDVFTTGATIVSCIESILKAVPSCRISVVTLALSRSHIIGNAI